MSERAAPQDTPSPAPSPIAFGPPERALFGVYHAPEGPPAPTIAVVLCNPLGYEAMSVHRTYRHLAERLAARGFAALRFDYDGTGDSAGQSHDPGRVRACLASIKAAIAEARARAGTSRVVLFGVRIGATLAGLAAADDGDLEGLVCWAPVISGRIHVRELRGFRLIKTDHGPPLGPRSDGSEEVGGYLYTAETLADLSAIDLLKVEARVAKRVLVLPRTERSREEARLVEHMSARGADVQFSPTGGYARMMRDDPYETVVPVETLDVVVEWLSEVSGAISVRPPPSAPASAAPAATILVRAADGKSVLKETALRFGGGERLFGVLTEPDGPGARRDQPVFCFLNVGANHHVGPHRMNVDLARDLASRGYFAFRLDAAGLGESRVEPGIRENRIYTKEAVADVKDAMTLLGDLRGSNRFVLVGLCSGAYLAFHAALADSRVVGQVLLSPYAFEWKEGDPVTPTMRKPFRSNRFYARALLDHQVWLRAMRGDVELRAIAGALLERVQTQVDAALPYVSARLRGRRRPQNEVEHAFVTMCERGVESLMVLSFQDGGLDMVAGYLGSDARKMHGRKTFSFKVVDGADHTFTTIASQEKLRALLTDYVTSRF